MLDLLRWVQGFVAPAASGGAALVAVRERPAGQRGRYGSDEDGVDGGALLASGCGRVSAPARTRSFSRGAGG